MPAGARDGALDTEWDTARRMQPGGGREPIFDVSQRCSSRQQHLRTSSHTRRASHASRSVWAGGKFRCEYVCVQTECQSFCGAPQWRSPRGIGVDRSHKPVTIRECKHMASTSRSAVSYAPPRRWEPTRARRRARSDQPARRAASRQSGAIAAMGSLSACTGLQPGGVSCRRRSSPKVSAVGG
jgi:hypothetical protein